MEWREDACIISGSHLDWPNDSQKTVIELWCRSKLGHSILLLVNGLKPYIEISDPMTNSNSKYPTLSLDEVTNDSRVLGNPIELGNKLYNGQQRPHWRINVTSRNSKQYNTLQKKLSTDGWDVTSSDIFLVHKLLMDFDLGPHISFSGKILWAGNRAPDEVSRTTNSELAAEEIRKIGGAGLYPVDLIMHCDISCLERADPFPTPFVTFSYDLETSVKHNNILCAAAVIDRKGERIIREYKGTEREIMEGLTRLVRDEDPDFITGYNIDNFDLPRMEERSIENSPNSLP
ncbi:MAG: hypothetical protein HN939_06310, partial [Euryarchaeota archaeon]|nr:hypothetical protein [Euryarchaeota archaeon]